MNTTDSDNIFKESNYWSQVLKIKAVIVNTFFKNVGQLPKKAISFRTVKQLELQMFEKQQIYSEYFW